ncbi:MAG TPA: Wzz/FepE/Etk N-terminal domain-containing protein, partial [Pyrinomonadaceae bacterium]
MSQDNRLLPLSSANESLDRPLRDVAHSAPVASASGAEPAHLREYLAVVLKRKWLILSLMVVVTSLVAIQMYRLPSIYSARTQIQIEQKQRSVLQTSRTGDLIIRGGNDPAYWNTQIKKLESQQLARQVVTRLDLQNNPAFLGANRGSGLITSLRRIVSREKAPAAPQAADEAGVPVLNEDVATTVESLTPEQARQLEPYEDKLREGLTIEPIERTNLVYIHYRHNEP